MTVPSHSIPPQPSPGYPGYDVIVVGLGGMGSAAAYRLAARGQRVLGLEQFDPVHRQGSSHGGSRIIRQAYFEDPAYVPLLLRAYELWEQVGRDTDRDILRVTGGLMLGKETSQTVLGSQRSALEWGLEHEMLDAGQVRHRFPTMAPTKDIVALYEARAGLVRPEASVAAHLQLAERSGAELHFGEPVTGWSSDSSGVTVQTSRGSYRADRLVVAPGAWAGELLFDLGVPFSVERYVQYWFDPVGGTPAFLPDRHPIYIWEAGDKRQFYGFPAIDGPVNGVKVAFFRGGTPCTPETIDRTVHPDEVDRIRGYIRPRIPTLPGRLLQTTTCMYTNTPDQHFVIAHHPKDHRVTLACGFSGHGFKFVSVVGEIVADLAVDGSTRHPIGLFDPARLLTPAAS